MPAPRLIAGLVAAVAVTATVVAVVGLPAATGPAPVGFALTDEPGRWFDSGRDVLGGRSLAVGVLPRVDGAAADSDTDALLNLDRAERLIGLTGSPRLADTPSLMEALNLDRTVAAVRAIGTRSGAAPLAVRAESLLGQLVTELGPRPVDAPIRLADLPVAAELDGVLAELRAFGTADPAVEVTFDVDPARSTTERNPRAVIAPEAAAGFPFADPAGPFFGSRTIRLTEPGLYAFTDAGAPSPTALGAVVVDDPLTIGLDFGDRLRIGDAVAASGSPEVLRAVRDFLDLTAGPGPRPPMPVLARDDAGAPVLIPNLDAALGSLGTIPPPAPPLPARDQPRTTYLADPGGTSISCVSVAEDACADGRGGRVHSRVIALGPTAGPATTGPAGTGLAPRGGVGSGGAAGSGAAGSGAAGSGAAGSGSGGFGSTGSGGAGSGSAGSGTSGSGVSGSGGSGSGGSGSGGSGSGVSGSGTTASGPSAFGAGPGTSGTVGSLAAGPGTGGAAGPDTSARSASGTPLPMAPDGSAVLAPRDGSVAVVDPATNRMVAEVPCAGDCRDVEFRAKPGGGFLAYVTGTLGQVVQIVDLDPDDDGRILDARIVGLI